jgi:hypothetical protein
MTVLDEEIIAWTSVADALPDADTTVLVHAREADEPVALGYFDGHSWFGARGGKLISPEGWEITVGDLLALPLMRQQLAVYKAELRKVRAELVLTHEQPLPETWPEWVFEKRA